MISLDQLMHRSNPWHSTVMSDRTYEVPYSFVGKRIRKEQKIDNSVMQIEECPVCMCQIQILNTELWRNSGAGLICHVCSASSVESLVANDTFEKIRVDRNGRPVLPKRLIDDDMRQSEKNDKWHRQLELALDRAMDSNNENPWVLIHRTALSFQSEGLKGLESRMSYLDRGVLLAPNDAFVYAWRAVIYGYLGNNELAINDTKKAIQLDPDFVDAYIFLGYKSFQEKPGLCNEVLSKAKKRFPNDARVLNACRVCGVPTS